MYVHNWASPLETSIVFSLFLCLCVLLFDFFVLILVYDILQFSNDLFLCFCSVIMSGMDSDEELFLTQNSFSQEILQPKFSIDSLLDAIEGSDEPVPQDSCAEELKKIVPDESI